MTNRLTSFILLVVIMVTFSGCGVLEDIFAAGAWVGAVGVAILIALIFIIVRAFRR